MKSPKGFFITFEGLDGLGKSTQVDLLYEYLKTKTASKDIIVTHEPGGTVIGEEIRNLLLTKHEENAFTGWRGAEMTGLTEALLFAASRAQLVEEIIKPALDKGKIVICDRFADSSRAFQVAGRKLKSYIVEDLISIATDCLQPDLTILLDAPEKKYMEKERNLHPDRIESESLNFHRRVRKEYKYLAGRNGTIQIIDASGTIEQTHTKIRVLVDKEINSLTSIL